MTFLIPLFIGAGIMALACWKEIPKRTQMNRLLVAAAMLSGSLLWWLASAILLVQSRKYFGMLNVLQVFIFAVGIAFLLPAPGTARDPKKQNLITSGVIVAGFLLGCAHAIATGFTVWWLQTLIKAYVRIGLH